MGSAISHIGRALAAALVLFALPAFAEVGVRLVAPPPADAHRHRIEQVRQRLLGRLAEPGAAADVYELEELLAQGGSLERAADLLYRVVESWRTHPHVRALARRTLAEVERQRGRLPRMQAQLAALGVVTDVSVVGPFPNENGEGFARRFGPEEGGGLDAVYEGAGHPVRWRALPGLGGRGAILLEEAFRDGGERTVYVLTELSAPRAMPATLFLGTPGPTRAWLGGKAILSDPDDHPARFDQRAIPLKLEAGKNLLLLKIASRGRWPLVLELRVADAQGKAIPGLRARAPGAGTLPPAERIPAGRVLRGETPLLSELAGVQSARGLEDRARILGARHPFDARARLHVAAAERAARAAPHRVEAQLLAARFQAEDGDARRAWLEKAIAAERPGELFAHAELAQHHLDRGAPWKAIELLAPRLERAPGDWPAHLVWARAWEALGESARARTIVEELLQRFPDEPELHARLAHHALRDGQIDEAVRRLRVGLALRPADRSMASSLATTLAAAGKVRAALDVLAGAERLAVIDLGLLGWRAELLAANGELGAARELLRRALAIAPDAPAHWERLGRIELEFGDAEAAREAFLTAVRLAPQNAVLREQLEALGAEEDRFAAPFLRDLFAEARGFVPADEDAVRLAEVHAVRVLPSGQAARTVQSIVWVGNQRGVDRFRTFGVRHAPDRELLRVVRARILRPDGSIDTGHVVSERPLHDTEAGIYYDARLRQVSFPSLRPGDVVEFVYQLDDIARDNLLADSFGDVELAQDTVPIRSWEYVLWMPSGREVYANAPEGARYEREARDGGVVHRWRLDDVPKLVAEPRMPGWVERARYLHVSTFADWNEVARTWWGLVKDAIEPTEEIRALAAHIVAGIPARDVRARVRAIHRHVLETTRYVGLEFGIHSFKPYPVEQVLRRGFGDCKDKASLMHALLRAVGIDARLVLLRMRHLGHMDPHPASLAVFNHAILYVPALDLYLDGTAEWSGTTELPEADRDADILVVHPDGTGTRTRTGVGGAEDNRVETRFRLALAEDLRAVGEGEVVARGLTAPPLRRTYASPLRRRQSLERRFSEMHPGLHAGEVDASDPRALDEAFALRFAAEIPGFAERTQDALVLHPLGKQSRLLHELAPLGSRSHPLVLPPPGSERLEVEVDLPAGMAPLALPEGGEVSTPFGVFKLEARMDGGRLIVAREIAWTKDRVPPEDYPAFREFLRRVDALAAPRIVLRAGATPAG